MAQCSPCARALTPVAVRSLPSLNQALKDKLISESEIDAAVKRLFTARFRLGMFDPPQDVPYARIPHSEVDSQAHRMLARRVAQESIVLLKNEDGYCRSTRRGRPSR
jgi:beta-glucosidase-like glycosyl hydrolase